MQNATRASHAEHVSDLVNGLPLVDGVPMAIKVFPLREVPVIITLPSTSSCLHFIKASNAYPKEHHEKG